MQLATHSRLFGHGARHDGAVTVERQDVVALAQIHHHGGTLDEAVFLVGRILQLVGRDAQRLQVLFVIDIGPGTGHAGHAAFCQINACACGVGGVRRVERDATAGRLNGARAVDRAARHIDHPAVARIAVAVGHRGLVGGVGHHLGRAALFERHRARLRAVLGASLQIDRAVGLHRGLGRDAPFLVDGQCGQRHVASIGTDAAGVADQAAEVHPRTVGGSLDLDAITAQGQVVGIVVEREVGLGASGQYHLPVGRADQAALVVDVRRKHHDGAAGIRIDDGRCRAGGAVLADAHLGRQAAIGAQSHERPALVVGTLEGRRGEPALGQRLTREIVGVRHLQVQGRRDQRLRVDLRTAVEQDAVLVDQQHLTVGRELALDDAGVSAVDAVECRGGAVGLPKDHLAVLADVEGLPIDDGPLSGLVHRQHRSSACGRGGDHGPPTHYGTRHGQGARGQHGASGLRLRVAGRAQPQQAQCSQHPHAAAVLPTGGVAGQSGKADAGRTVFHGAARDRSDKPDRSKCARPQAIDSQDRR